MVDFPGSESQKTLDQVEHNVASKAKRVIPRVFNSDTGEWENASISGGKLVYEQWDYVSRALTNSTTETYTYKIGGSSGTTVATVVIVYTASDLDTISTVTKT